MVRRFTFCQWYAMCSRPAAGTVRHPGLGDVPTCETCAEQHGLTLEPDPTLESRFADYDPDE